MRFCAGLFRKTVARSTADCAIWPRAELASAQLLQYERTRDTTSDMLSLAKTAAASSMTVSSDVNEAVLGTAHGLSRRVHDKEKRSEDFRVTERTGMSQTEKFCSIRWVVPWRVAAEHTSASLLRVKQARSRDAVVMG